MLFNSYEFIFAFLPVTAAVFYIFGRFSRTLALRWLIGASVFFYAWWRPLNVLIIAPSIAINFVLARLLERCAEEKRQQTANAILLAGIAFNIAFLGYFKYNNFFQVVVNDVFGTQLTLTQVILPLGISFITFQKIAFLIDVHARRIDSFSLQEYCLFVLFFPQLIAGPIVHYREMMPQFRDTACRFEKTNASVGLTLFFFGLFKKVVLADSIAPVVTSIYNRAGEGADISLFPAWMAAIGFTLQMYFDFSGYSDMALGAARFFGIRLPANFNSPLRASSIIDFWLRWHMTLTRFLTAYIYNPLVLALTRRRLAGGRSGFGGRNTTFGSFASLLMFPTLLTMFLSGLWHGAGYLFAIWGLLHGVYLTINHGWRLLKPRWLSESSGFALTFLSVVAAMVFFRSPTLSSAGNILKGLVGLNGITMPAAIHEQLPSFGSWFDSIGVVPESWLGGTDFVLMAIGIPILLFIALSLPNSLQVLSLFEPALGLKPNAMSKTVAWDASLAWAIVTAVAVAIGIFRLGGQSEFLYWQF